MYWVLKEIELRQFVVIFALGGLMIPFFDISATEPLQITTSTAVVLPIEKALQHSISTQLPTNEISVLIEHLQSQHVYLKHLDNVRRAVEKELSIVRLMSECDRFGSTCTGRGIVENIMLDELPSRIETNDVVPISVQAQLPLPLQIEPTKHIDTLPIVVGVYRKTASLIYKARPIEVHEGEKIGPFTVAAVTLDGVEFEGPQGKIVLPVHWHVPVAESGFSVKD